MLSILSILIVEEQQLAKWQKERIQISKNLTPSQRKAVAQEIIDFIVERTEKGKDKNNSSFGRYSKSYKESLDFKLGGKSRFQKPDLTLTGEMLAELDLISHKNGSLLIGYDKGDADLNGKVEGNRLGTYGNKSKVGPARDFLGIADKDLKKILSKYDKKESAFERAARLLAAAEAARRISGIDGEGSE